MADTYGERIDATQANAYFKAFDNVQSGLKFFSRNEDLDADRAALAALGQTYSQSPFNAFLFKRDIVEDLMNLVDVDGKKPEFLMIHFAAHPNDKPNPGEPTLVILGCNKKSKGDFISMLESDGKPPGAETPGKTVQALFPDKRDDKSIRFKMI